MHVAFCVEECHISTQLNRHCPVARIYSSISSFNMIRKIGTLIGILHKFYKTSNFVHISEIAVIMAF